MLRCLQQEDGHLTAFAEQLIVDVTPYVLNNINEASAPMKCAVTATTRPQTGFRVFLQERPGHSCTKKNYVNVSDKKKSMLWTPNCFTLYRDFVTYRNVVSVEVNFVDLLHAAPFRIQVFASEVMLQVVHRSTLEG